jgi:hypothetical protein
VSAQPQPDGQDDFLAAPLGAFPNDDIPPDDWALAWPDPDTGRPLELADLSLAELDELATPAIPPLTALPQTALPQTALPQTAFPQTALSQTAPPETVRSGTAPPTAAPSAAAPAVAAEVWPAGCFPRDGAGRGTGFADGGVLDGLAPGVALAGFAADAHARLDRLTDDELIGVLRAWRRQTSWAQARELAVVAELARRRPAPGVIAPPEPTQTAPAAGPGHTTPGGGPGQASPAGGPGQATPGGGPGQASPAGGSAQVPGPVSEFAADEIAIALTLTSIAAQHQLALALDLAGKPALAAVLETGQLDLARVKVILSGTSTLTPAHAAAVEVAVLPRAPWMTTGQLRAAVARAVYKADPLAALRGREAAQRTARVEYWTDAAGTGSLAGRCLPPAETLAADQRLCQLAKRWKKQGATAGMDMLRARAYLALLLGHDISTPPPDLLPPALTNTSTPQTETSQTDTARTSTAQTGTARADTAQTEVGRAEATQADTARTHSAQTAAAGVPLAGSINLTLPLATLLGWSQAPGEATGYGPLDAWTARQLARSAAGHPDSRWHLTITDNNGRALAHGCAPRRTPRTGENWTFTLSTEPIARDTCDHHNAEPGYRPSPHLTHLVQIRSDRCTFPCCRRPATTCDEDHTIPHGQDGLTCECNLSPLCRFHHRLKQSQHWTLEQTTPGTMTWITPSNRRHTTLPTQHPT